MSCLSVRFTISHVSPTCDQPRGKIRRDLSLVTPVTPYAGPDQPVPNKEAPVYNDRYRLLFVAISSPSFPPNTPHLNMTPIHVHIFSCGPLAILCCPMFIHPTFASPTPTSIHSSSHREIPRNCRNRRRCSWIRWQGICFPILF